MDGGECFAVDANLIVADAYNQRPIPCSNGDVMPRGDREPRHEEESGELRDASNCAASDVTPKFVSPSNPTAQWTSAMGGRAFFA